jgi:hypothetical protein
MLVELDRREVGAAVDAAERLGGEHPMKLPRHDRHKRRITGAGHTGHRLFARARPAGGFRMQPAVSGRAFSDARYGTRGRLRECHP